MKNYTDQELYELNKDGTTYEKLAQETDSTRGTIAGRIYRYKARIETTINFEDKKQPEDVNWRELLNSVTVTQEIEDRLDSTQEVASIHIDTVLPIAVMFTGDWQLGDLATDHVTWKQDMEYVLDTPGLFMVCMGDEIQNMRAFKNLSNVLGQALSPRLQGLMLKGIVDELTDKKKILAKVSGNHDDEFDERLFGQRITEYLLSNLNAPYFKNRGLLKLKVGTMDYTMLLFHKSRFKSFLRATHGEMREHQLSFPADIVAGAHDHIPGYERISHYTLARDAGYNFGGKTYLIKTGTYQSSGYGWKYFSNGGFPLNPTVVLFPNLLKMEIFDTPQDAMTYIGGLDIPIS